MKRYGLEAMTSLLKEIHQHNFVCNIKKFTLLAIKSRFMSSSFNQAEIHSRILGHQGKKKGFFVLFCFNLYSLLILRSSSPECSGHKV